MEKEIRGIEIIEKYPILQKALRFIIENNESNSLPYHNLHHGLTVLKYCNIIAHGEFVYYDQMIPLYLASLFHDFNHSGGKLKDCENIENAKKGFNIFAKENNLDEGLIFQVEVLINATEFPYTSHNSNISQFEKIIRDADMMQQFEHNWISQTTLGLSLERGITMKEFILQQRHFFEATTYLTKTARDLKKKNWRNVMHEFRVLEIAMGIQVNENYERISK